MATGKITLQTLSEIMAGDTGRSKTSTEMFVRAFFTTLKEALAKDNIVKIKGLGTFKMVVVNARESINVNTGKRVSIAEYNKITFTPDKNLRDKVNRPFSQFETVIIDDEDVAAVIGNGLDSDGNTTAGSVESTETKERTDCLTVENTTKQETPEVVPSYPCAQTEESKVEEEEADEGSQERKRSGSCHKRFLWWSIPVVLVLIGVTYVIGYMRIVEFPPIMGGCDTNVAVKTESPARLETAKTRKRNLSQTTATKETTPMDNDTTGRFPQITGGKYLITGIKTYRRIKPDYDVRRYCLQIYGNKDCLPYVLILNGIKKEDEIRIGRILKFPVLTENNVTE